MGKKWTAAQHRKFAATSKRMRAAGEWAVGGAAKKKAKKSNGHGKKKAMLIPFKAIGARPVSKSKPRSVDHRSMGAIAEDEKRLQLAMATVALLHKLVG